MVTFKSRDFCFTLNNGSISYILSGKSAIKDSEKKLVASFQSNYNEILKQRQFDDTWGDSFNGKQVTADAIRKRSSDLINARLSRTIVSIVTIGGVIDISTHDILHLANLLKREDDDFYTYIAVTDIVDYIIHKLSNSDNGCVDFETVEVQEEFRDFCNDAVESRKRLITKSIVLKENDTVKLSDYLIYYCQNDGNYFRNTNGGDTNGK